MTEYPVEGAPQVHGGPRAGWMTDEEFAARGHRGCAYVYRLSVGDDPYLVPGELLFEDWAGHEILLPDVECFLGSAVDGFASGQVGSGEPSQIPSGTLRQVPSQVSHQAPPQMSPEYRFDQQDRRLPTHECIRKALTLGSWMYRQGMDLVDPEVEWARIASFQAAELLYLHAAALGSHQAFENLGYVYSYNRCQGQFWTGGLSRGQSLQDQASGGQASRDQTPAVDTDARAFQCFGFAASGGSGEACYKYGDMLRAGRGCEIDLASAVAWYQKGYEYGRNEAPVVWGSAAWRLGRAYRDGEGCAQDFRQAKKWYARAVMGLDMAVRGGERWYRNVLTQAQDDLAVVNQELDGRY